uniref:Oxysterol-binding protein-related protein 4C-like n=1 Tax=Rhizophora mucronata TaxID=61149 RepID=A0A2P2KPJ8_RHIMU
MASQGEFVLAKPLSLDGDFGFDCKAPNVLQRILSLLKNVRPGSDLARFQVPPTFNAPKSQLQWLGEPIYCTSKELLHECNNPKSSLDRFLAVVAWAMSSKVPVRFGVAPYNPILGETHHVSRGSLNVILEQVSHHPPVACFHATDEEENIDITWCQHPVAKFCGTKVEVEVHGKRQLKLLNYGETYVIDTPKLLVKFLSLENDWFGNVSISCHETGLEAELCYTSSSFLSRKGKHSIKGKIYDRTSQKTLYEIGGHWNGYHNALLVSSKCSVFLVLLWLIACIVENKRYRPQHV